MVSYVIINWISLDDVALITDEDGAALVLDNKLDAQHIARNCNGSTQIVKLGDNFGKNINGRN